MEAEAAEGEEAVEAEAVKDKEEEVKEVQEIKVKEMEIKEIKEVKDLGVKGSPRVSNTTPIKPLAMLICPHLRPVSGTGPSGSPPTFVWSPAPAPGASSGCPSQTTNEILTSSGTEKTASSYIICCTLKRRI